MATGDKITYSGDALTITGENGLTLESQSQPLVIKSRIRVKEPGNKELGTTHSDWSDDAIEFVDSNTNRIGRIQPYYESDNNNTIGMWVNDATNSKEIGISVSSNGITYSPASRAINSIVTTTGISLAGNGYVKFGNGLIIQWGNKVWNGAWNGVTYPTAFSNTNYSITASGYRTDGNPYQGFVSIKDRTNTSCNMWFSDDSTSNGGNITWIAIGY